MAEESCRCNEERLQLVQSHQWRHPSKSNDAALEFPFPTLNNLSITYVDICQNVDKCRIPLINFFYKVIITSVHFSSQERSYENTGYGVQF